MPAAFKRQAYKDPQGISYEPGRSNPERTWAITLPQPLASLIAGGRMWGFTRSSPPPKEMIGRRLVIHCGQGLTKLTPIKENAYSQSLIALEAMVKEEDWRAGIDKLSKTYAGKTIGTAQLRGAFVLGQTVGVAGAAKCAASLRPDSFANRYLGAWRQFDGKSTAPIGDWSNYRKGQPRWVWCLDMAHRIPAVERAALRGFGGLWDLDKGKAYREAQR